MKRLSLLLLFGTITLVFSSCTPNRRVVGGYRPYGIYPSYIYDEAPGGWDVYQSGGGTRVKYSQ